ncbi:MAG: LTA synthase family protein [Candidatus Omnitrophica bacterium]|nr:LTA synthase family protein [Candidatus Omnitrophota bacterium]
MIKEFLKENKWWDNSFLFIGSDHGCHYGCDVSVEEGRKRGVPEEELINYCSNHQEPYGCFLWDFTNNRSSDKRIDCTRRTTFIASGGALDKKDERKG